MGGVPGTVGGAAIMNAGAFGNDIAAVLSGVAVLGPGVGLAWHRASDFRMAYRETDLKDHGVVAGCRMNLAEGDAAEIRARFEEVKSVRAQSQPWRAATAGSVFKNPPGDAAGRILESLGFKGKALGGAAFSDLHANFLTNRGDASFEDAFALCEMARQAAASSGTALDYEMEIWR